MQKKNYWLKSTAFAGILVTCLLIGCGQKGPLELPEPAEQNDHSEKPEKQD